MTHQLFLMRHAKSDWSQNLRDHDRPLNARGRRAARDMGYYLREQKLCPDKLYCSTAERARQTVQGLLQQLDYSESDVIWDSRIYHASLYELLSLLAEWLPQSGTIMLVGHNPGMQDLLYYIVPAKQIDATNAVPTAAFAQIELPDNAPYHQSCGVLLRHVVPRQLEGRYN